MVKVEPVSMVAIAAELHARLAAIMEQRHLGPVPPGMIDRRPDRIFIGKAKKEHRALGILYDSLAQKHKRLHEETGLKIGVNPYVPAEHFHLHVLMPLVDEMLEWSAFRAYPNQKSGLSVRFDRDWNMFGQFPDRFREKDTKAKKP